MTMLDSTDQMKPEHRLRLRGHAVEVAADAMFTFRIDGQIVDVNQAAVQCLGFSRSEILDLRFDDIASVENDDDFKAILEKIRSNGVLSFHLQLQSSDGLLVEADVLARLFEFEGFEYVCVTVRNKNDERTMPHELQLIIDSVPAFIGFVTTDQRYQFVNSFYEEHYGLSRDEICGMTIRELNGEETYRQCRPYIEAALRGQNVQFEFVSPEEDRKHYLIKYEPRIKGKVTGYYVISTDITAIKNAEAELIKSERELRQAHNQFQDIAILAHRDRLSSMGEMASAIAHELNQPLMVISGLAHVLTALISDSSIDKKRISKLAETIEFQAVQAGDIAHRMRGFVSNKYQHREHCDLNSIVQDAIKMTQASLDSNRIKLVTELDPVPGWISADPIQIQQVIVNLIRNAAEAMADQETPTPVIQIVTSAAESDSICLSVQDTGPGISDEQRSKLFVAFESTKQEGMGMGLAIGRTLIESHNGELRLDVDYRDGASFVMVLSKLNELG